MKKKFFSVFVKICAIVIAILVILMSVILLLPNHSGIERGENVVVVVPQGSSVGDIAKILKKNEVISNELSFMARAVLSGKKSKLKYGEFSFSSDMGYGEIIDIICNEGAQRKTITIVIPEGYSVEMIAEKFVSSGIGTHEEFEAAFNDNYDYEFINYIVENPACKYKLQGFLFPSTYEFYEDVSAREVVDTMLKEFEKQFNKTGASYENLSEIITKASLVEREAKLDEERPMIAGVINNRIETDMRLQIDATVVYAISDGMYDVERVLYKDLEIESEYNTYRNKGLPAGPICNPGFKSVEAVLNPAEHEYLYYHTDTAKNDGSHIFSKTFEEHKQ